MKKTGQVSADLSSLKFQANPTCEAGFVPDSRRIPFDGVSHNEDIGYKPTSIGQETRSAG